MMAISIRQPWASLIATGEKRIETRSWQPPKRLVGERIAIHASKQPVNARRVPQTPMVMPLGAVISTVRLVSVERITSDLRRALARDERRLGVYRVGLYAWHLADPEPVEPPVFLAGRLGFFDVGLPS